MTDSRFYRNPVYPHSCPDPFVIKYCGEYWCYFTGRQPDDRCFGILHSLDLVNWERLGSAMDPLPPSTLPYPDLHYWAPEVVYSNGKFYMYYSVGDEVNMQVRVAVADHPAGPFWDSGWRLTAEPFAIDPHVFVDEDGSRYLFYATDYLTHERVGTGTAFDRLITPYQTAGKPCPVTRARFDWQIYDPHRTEKGGVCWHTLEGSFVLKHAGKYYQMFSGGNWQNDTYGVAYGVTADLNQPAEWDQPCDGIMEPQILRSLPRQGVIGPGHNSVVRGPDNHTLYCVYHRWQPETSERVLAIDRLFWEEEKLRIAGPSSTPQPAPPMPDVSGFADFTRGREMKLGIDGNELRLAADQQAFVHLPTASEFVLEVSMKRVDGGRGAGLGFVMYDDDRPIASIMLDPRQKQLSLDMEGGTDVQTVDESYDAAAFHLLRLESKDGVWAVR
ncbi:MAG: glycoside hydrolase family 43 protein, partial [Anaerolineaceae bacterium]|nr:glycoside hydrolase family 43 protein [Anaerolineaceae bacterium]